VLAEGLYLANLLVLPGLAFVVLALLYLRRDRTARPLFAAHLEQTFAASLWAGALLVLVNLLILALGGYRGPYTWTVVIVYFTVCHSSLVLLGMFGLAKAMAGQCFRYPLIGRTLPPECRQWERGGRLL
jgi:hypothetical protein